MIRKLLAGNRYFVKNDFNKRLKHYQSIAEAQTPTVLWIGCSDSRVAESVVTWSRPGTIFVHRNVANIVAFNDVNISAIIDYAISYLKIPDIVICGHTKCGGIAAMYDGIENHYIADWLLVGSGARRRVEVLAKKKKLNREQKLKMLTEENVRLQIRHLKELSIIKHRRAPEVIPRIHGWIYDVDTGKIRVLHDEYAIPSDK
jgi:carbonic anhydrase